MFAHGCAYCSNAGAITEMSGGWVLHGCIIAKDLILDVGIETLNIRFVI